MKELFAGLEHKTHFRNGFLLDTCFFINIFDHSKEKELERLMGSSIVAVTSFNVSEFLKHDHRISDTTRDRIRKFLKHKPNLVVLDIDVSPGDWQGEKDFVARVEPELLEKVPDPSDAVIMAAAILTHSTVLTKDKHHLFTTKLENYLNRYSLSVFKDFHEI